MSIAVHDIPAHMGAMKISCWDAMKEYVRAHGLVPPLRDHELASLCAPAALPCGCALLRDVRLWHAGITPPNLMKFDGVLVK